MFLRSNMGRFEGFANMQIAEGAGGTISLKDVEREPLLSDTDLG